MPYRVAKARPIKLWDEEYNHGDIIPDEKFEGIERNRRALLALGRIEKVVEAEPVTVSNPVYTGAGWWQMPDGTKKRGKKDSPPEA